MGLPTPRSTAVSILTRLSGGAHAAATFIALATLPLMATSVSAHVWWTAQGADGRWNTDNNWVLGYYPYTSMIPDETLAAYITTSEHAGLSNLPAAWIDETITGNDRAKAEQL